MEKSISTICCVFCCIIFLSCNSDSSPYYSFKKDSFQKKIDLSGNIFQLKNVKKPVGITIIPDYNIIVVLESDKSNYLAYAYSLDSFNLIKKFCKHGANNDDLIIASNLRYEPNLKLIKITDPIRQIIHSYSIDSIINPKAAVRSIQIVDLHEAVVKINENLKRPFFLNNRIIDFKNNRENSPTNIFNYYTLNGDLLYSWGDFPKNKYSKLEVSQVYSGGLNLSNDKKHIILNYYNTDIIDLYDTTGILLKRVQGPDNYSPEFSKRYIGEEIQSVPTFKSHYGYTGSPRMKDSLLFVLYSGLSRRDPEYHTKSLFKFNDLLQPLALYNLNVPVFDFDIYWSNKKIYALSHKPTASIVVYNF